MRKNYVDPERRRIGTLIDAEVGRAREAEQGGGWITYLVRDPRNTDHRGNPGVPIYVGQSKEFATRVRSRFEKCEKNSTKKDSIERRVADLLHEGWVASYEVLERVPTRLQSLVSETNWARACVRRGYNIANLLSEQRVSGPPISRLEIPPSWLWKFLIEEAIADGIVIEIGCRSCGMSLDVDPAHFQSVDSPPRELWQIKLNSFWKHEPCTNCKKAGMRFVRPRVA